MGSTDEPNRFQHTRVLGVEDVVANTGEGGVPAIVENAAGRGVWKGGSRFVEFGKQCCARQVW